MLVLGGRVIVGLLLVLGLCGVGTAQDLTIYLRHPWSGDANRGSLPVFMMSFLNWYPGVQMEHVQGDWYSFTFRNAARTNNERLEFSTSYNFYNDRWGTGLSLQAFFGNNTHTEVFLTPVAGSTPTISYVPPTAKVVAVFNPWTTTGPRLVSGGRMRPMRAIPGRCGWFAWALVGDSAGISGYFRQNFGTETWGVLGWNDTTAVDFSPVLLTQDTVWVVLPAASRGPAEISALADTREGPCLIPTDTMVVAATIRDFSPLFPDVQGNWSRANAQGSGICGLVRGLVLPQLGIDGKPVPTPDNPALQTCNATNLSLWFTTDTVITPPEMRRYATCQNIALVRDENRVGAGNDLYVFDNSHFLPLNNFRNPNHPTGSGDNFGFCMEINAQFTYRRGQVFDFRGDDDVWVYIDRRLVIDIGGIHNPEAATVYLDTLGLTVGNEYSFAMFFCERQTTGSNIRINTSLDLRTSRLFQHNESTVSTGVRRFDLLESITTAGLGCEEQVRTGTNPARARIAMSGPGINVPILLGAGVSYGGIRVAEDSTWFIVDTSAIAGLMPGVYTISFTDLQDSRLSGNIQFEVAPFPIPDLRFISHDSSLSVTPVLPGPWALVAYPLRLEAWYRNRNQQCNNCSDTIRLTGVQGLEFRDSLGRLVDRIPLRGGYANLWVTATETLENVRILAAGPYPEPDMRDSLVGLNFRMPDFAVPRYARIFDGNGDGIADSLWVGFDRSLRDDMPNMVSYRWPADGALHTLQGISLAPHINGDTSLVFVGNFTVGVLTTGSGLVEVTRDVEGTVVRFPVPIEEFIGPVALQAKLQPVQATLRELQVLLSEDISRTDTAGVLNRVLLYHIGATGQRDVVLAAGTAVRTGENSLRMLISGVPDLLPVPGDSLRLAFTEDFVVDLQGNAPHSNNPYVVITGEASLAMESANIITVRRDYPVGAPGTQVVAVSTGMRAQEVAVEQGRLGHLVRNPLQVMLAGLPVGTPLAEVYLNWETWYYTNQGSYVSRGRGQVRCDDQDLFGGDCRSRNVDLYLAWNPVAEDGRLLGSGAYITRLKMEARGPQGTVASLEDSRIWGLRRVKD